MSRRKFKCDLDKFDEALDLLISGKMKSKAEFCKHIGCCPETLNRHFDEMMEELVILYKKRGWLDDEGNFNKGANECGNNGENEPNC